MEVVEGRTKVSLQLSVVLEEVTVFCAGDALEELRVVATP